MIDGSSRSGIGLPLEHLAKVSPLPCGGVPEVALSGLPLNHSASVLPLRSFVFRVDCLKPYLVIEGRVRQTTKPSVGFGSSTCAEAARTSLLLIAAEYLCNVGQCSRSLRGLKTRSFSTTTVNCTQFHPAKNELHRSVSTRLVAGSNAVQCAQIILQNTVGCKELQITPILLDEAVVALWREGRSGLVLLRVLLRVVARRAR